jgi:hypothetical protein
MPYSTHLVIFLAEGGDSCPVTVCISHAVPPSCGPAAVRLVLVKQWRLLASLRSFWLTSLVAVLDHVGQVGQRGGGGVGYRQ